MSGYTYEDHLAMMRDEVRMPAYRAALAAVLHDGDVVVDLGAGGGVMTLLALELGASHVHAVEWSDNVDILARVARANGVADRITIHRDDSRRVQLDRRADVIVADLRGPLPVCGEGVAVLRDARARLLAPGGRMIPVADRFFVAPVEHPDAHAGVTGWKDEFACMRPIAANRYSRLPFGPEAVLAPALASSSLRYADTGHDLVAEGIFEFARAGTCHGLGAWFEVELAPGVVLSTAPEHGDTVYGHAYLPFDEAADVAAGDRVRAEVAIRTAPVEPVVLWSVEGAGIAERHCSVDGTIMSLEGLRKRSPDYVPSLTQAGREQLFVLQCMADGRSVADIGARLLEAFPGRFATVDDAVGFAGKLSAAFGA